MSAVSDSKGLVGFRAASPAVRLQEAKVAAVTEESGGSGACVGGSDSGGALPCVR